MGLFIQDINADYSNVPGAQRAYQDALVTKGTLLLYDFSRLDMLPTGTLKKGDTINDLARLGSTLNNSTNFKVTSPGNSNLNFLVNGSFLLKNTSATLDENTGIDIGKDLLNHLHDNNVTKALFIFWVFNESGGGNIVPVVQSKTTDNKDMIRLSVQATGNIVITINGVATPSMSPSDGSGQHRQMAVVYELGKPLLVYKSTVFSFQSTNNATAWGIPNTNLKFGQTSGSDANNTTAKMGRILIEDLDESGRVPIDVIKEDYEYVNGIGRYAGIPKRPYANL